MKAIILARVSDKKQDSNEAQVVRINDYIRYKDLTIWKTHEIEESSTRGDRTKFQEVIKEIKQSKECIALVVDTVDRLQRSFKESVLLDDLRKAGKIEIHFYRENLVIHKNSNSADLLRWDMAVMFARSYILQLSDNVKRKFEQMRKNGIWTGKAPLGYKNIGDERNRDIILDPKSSHLVQRIFELYSSGSYSIQLLSVQISKEGLRGTLGKPLVPGMVYNILNNPFYYGEMLSAGKIYPHRYMPLISKELFDICQRRMKGWNKKQFQYAAKTFIFRGLLRCAKCGCSMSPEIKKGKYVYYSCTTARKTICNKKIFVREEALLEPIYEVLKAYEGLPQETIDEIIDIMSTSNEHEIEFNAEAIKTLRSEYDAIQVKQNRLTDLLLEGTITTETYEVKLKQFKERQRDINQQIENHTSADENYHITAKNVLRLAKNAFALFKSSEPLEKRAMLNMLLQNSVVNGKNLEFSLRSPFNTIYDIATQPVGRGALDTFRTLDWKQIKVDLDKYNEQISQVEDLLQIAC